MPPGVLNVVQGLGPEAGAAVVEHPGVDLVSFTGSAATGRGDRASAGRRLAKVCLELGGKNALVVCDDADLDSAVRWALASAFSNAGQRCAAASRIVVFDAVYDEFRERFVAQARGLRDAGPVISERRSSGSSRRRRRAASTGLAAGSAPTVLEDVDARGRTCRATELFGPSQSCYRVRDFDEARPARQRLAVRADGRDPHSERPPRACASPSGSQAGVVVVNGGDLRLGAAHGLRRRQAVRHRLARGRRRGARRVLGLEVRQPDHDPAEV